jgi:predicted nuclease of predicted toxin-antitoxin system
MRLLFDQNISFRIVRKLRDIYPESRQIRELGLENFTDIKIWNYAKTHNFTIVTFDTDFYDISLLRGIPPKIIWLRIGNTKTENLIKVLRENSDLINEFVNNPSYKDIDCLEIY